VSGAERVDLATLVAAARELVADGQRRVLGITGAPGAGKSTLAREITEALDGRAVLVGLDSFHLSNAELHRLGRHARKGAADTFDAAGYQALLRRLRPQQDEIVYAAEFDRSLEESITCVVPVHRDVPLVVTEGNYLLVDDDRWGATAGLIDQIWYVEPGEDVRMERLIARHMRFGRSPQEAHERSYGSDQRNAELIASTRPRAHRILQITTVSEKELA
jgi:pantothenate kinase